MSPTMSPAEVTMSAWARLIEAYTDVPGDYLPFLNVRLVEGHPFPYTVLTPTREHILRLKTEKLIVDFGSEITVLERNGNVVTQIEYPVEGISYVEVKTVLLDSRIKICGLTSNRKYACSLLRYNAISDYLFWPILATIRKSTTKGSPTPERPELKNFLELAESNHKFFSYANRSLQPGESVLRYYFQPEIRLPLIRILGKVWYKTIASTHMVILTDSELILLQEEVRGPEREKYGGIRDFISLDKIVSIELNKRDKDSLELSVDLPGGEHLGLLYQPAAQQEIEQLVGRVQDITSR